MYKSHLSIIHVFHILLAGIFLQGCGTHNENKYSADYLDSLINVSPKTVYSILKQEKDSVSSKKAENRYALYSLLAKDKLYVKHTSDSLPNALISYYNEQENKKLLGLSYYMLGASYSDMGDVPEAVKAYLKALSTLNKITPSKYIGIVNSRIAYEYLKLGLYKESRKHYNQSLQKLIEESDSSRIAPICLQIANTYCKENVDSMIYWQKQSYSITTKTNNSYRKNSSLLKLTTSYLRNNDRKKAHFYLSKIDSTAIPTSLQERYYLARGEYYYNILSVDNHAKEELDSAHYYFTKLIGSKNHDSRSRAAYYLSTLAKRKGNYKTAFNLQRERMHFIDSLHNKKVFEATHKLEATYNYKLAQKAKEQAEEKARTYRYYSILISLLFVTFIVIAFLAISWRQLRTENKAVKDFALSKLLEGVRRNFGKRDSSEIEKLTPKALQEEGHNNFIYNNEELTTSYKQLREMLDISDRTIKDSEWQTLQKAVDKAIPDFSQHMSLLIPKKSRTQEKYCYLTKLGFKQNEIALLIPMTESGVSQLKRRLVGKINSEKVTTKNLRETIQNL